MDDLSQPLFDIVDDAYEHDLPPVPPALTSAARDAFSWVTADVRIADLLFDSAHGELVGVRGAATERRSFRFGVDDAVIRVHLTSATLIVMVEPPVSVPCRVATEAGSGEYRTDEVGELVIDAPELPIRVEVDLPGGTVATPWITS